MNGAPSPPAAYRFGTFQLDPRTRELLKDGQRIRIQEKPFLMLAFLLERAGEVVTREELRERLWPSDTFVEFDDNLNSTAKRVRETLGDTAERPRYIQTVPKRGYRFIPPVEILSNAAEQPSAQPVAPIRRPRIILSAAIALALALGASAYVWKSLQPQKITLAVLPFRNLSGDAAQDYLADGVTEQLTAHLGRLSPSKVAVISVTSAMRFKNTAEDVPSIARQLNASYLLEGSVRRLDGRFDVTAQLVRASDRTHAWAETYSLPADDFLRLQDKVVRGVAEALAIRLLPAESALLARAATTNTAAYDAYLAGLYQWNRGTRQSFQAALEQFGRAAALDPGYALAHDGMAKCYLELGDYRFIAPEEAMAKAQAEVSIALKLDDTIPESHVVAATVLDRTGPTAAGVDEGYRRALALNPSDARARRSYAMYLLGRRRNPEAVAQIEQAVRLDPLSPSAHSYAGWIYYSAKDPKRAWAESQRALELDPNYPFALYIQGHLCQDERKYDRAIAQYTKAVTSSGRTPKYLYALAQAYLAQGKRDPARQILAELQQQAKTAYVPPDYLQNLAAKLGALRLD
ncbi:MAG TPA: winged helix-turn-helix domain-containing protein [Bryobacteraceae bacterium]|nr:winged helix-turn-helix domain-containing protein [Bryobacteraceae bacterium]